MKKKKTFSRLSVCLVCAAMAVATAVGGVSVFSKKEKANAAIGELNTMDEFTIAGFVNYYDKSIASLEEQTRDLARSGMNWVDTPTIWSPLDGSVTGATRRDFWEPSEWGAYNELCRELNMYFSMTPQSPVFDETEILNVVNYAKDLDRCVGYYVKDEPSAAQFQSVANICRRLQELDPTRFPYVNLFPNYAGASNLGGSYEDYVRNWVATGAETIEYLYFDHYPFTQFEDVRASYFSDVETIRKVAFENNRLKTGGYTQMGWWNGMRRPTVAEARWSMNSLLSYGMKSISHFCWVSPAYQEPPAGEGMQDFVITNDGKPTDRYEPMQKLNWQTRQLGPVLMSFDVAHAYHSGEVPVGTEALPKAFLLQPSSQNDNLIFSLGYSKDDSEKYLMLFNKELTGSKKYTIKADAASGLTSLTWYKPDSFETLPDYTKPLAAPAQIEISVEGGSFEVELQAGEMRLYKLNGELSIREPLKAPSLSHKSGTYLGQQTVTLTSYDDGAEIYYTTDGSYPTYRSERYTSPIIVGQDGELGFFDIKAIAVRGTEISDAVIGRYIISDGSQNVALDREPTFTGETEAFQGSVEPGTVTDGSFDPHNTWGSAPNSPCFAVVDFGKEYTIDRVLVKAWHDWEFNDVIVQLALDENFTQGVYTVFNNDSDNSVGAGAGTDGAYKENPAGGHGFSFAPVKARYMRFHNASANTRNQSVWEEMQAYTSYSAGTELLSNTSAWRATGGGTWSMNGGVLSQTGAQDRDSWDRSYTYTAKKFKNFILEGSFTMKTSDPAAWGYVGFGLYKPEINNVQSDYDKGYYAVIEPRGRVLLWNGAKPELGPEDANVAGFALGSEFTLRVISVNNTVSISVNGKPVMYVEGDVFNREAGYISIHGGLIPIDVSKVRITELTDEQKPNESENCIKSAGEERVAVERFVSKAEVLASLPEKMSATDTAGNKYELPVKWSCESFNSTATGWTTFVGEFTSLPKNLVNLFGVTATANVFVRPYTDTSDLEELVKIARRVNPLYVTPESYENLRVKLEAAEALLADPFMVQNDIGVGVWQLFDQIEALVSTVDKSPLVSALASAKQAVENGGYTELSAAKIRSALEKAQAVLDDAIASPSDVSNAVSELDKAVKNGLKPKVPVSPQEKPAIYSAKKSGCKGTLSASVPFGMGAVMVVLLPAAALALKKRKKQN